MRTRGPYCLVYALNIQPILAIMPRTDFLTIFFLKASFEAISIYLIDVVLVPLILSFCCQDTISQEHYPVTIHL